MGFVELTICILVMLKTEFKRALIRYLSLAPEVKLQEMLIRLSPFIMKFVDVSSRRF